MGPRGTKDHNGAQRNLGPRWGPRGTNDHDGGLGTKTNLEITFGNDDHPQGVPGTIMSPRSTLGTWEHKGAHGAQRGQAIARDLGTAKSRKDHIGAWVQRLNLGLHYKGSQGPKGDLGTTTGPKEPKGA